jgi:DNA mismatch repair protein MutS2
LVLVDEICGSTDPEEGSAIARAFIERFAINGVFAVVTSHLSPLKVGWTKGSGVVNGSLEYDLQSGRPTYHFIKGVPGQSLAIKTAKRVGVSDAIVGRSLELLSPASRAYQSTMDELETMKEDLRRLREGIRQQEKQIEVERLRYEKLASDLEREKDVLLRKTIKEADKRVDELIERAKAEDVFKKHENLARLKSQLPEVVRATSGGSGRAETRIESVAEFAKRFPPGTRVFVPSLGRDAVVQGEPSGRGEVPVLSNSMRISVSWTDVKPPQQSSNPTSQIVRQTKGYSISPMEQDRVIDLRGLSVEEALQQLETQLDVAALNDEDRVKVIHGHGTEALKKSLRSYMSRSVYVKKWHAGTGESGGDGVTWVVLKET